MKNWSDFNLDIPLTAKGEYLTVCPECSSNRKKKLLKCLSVNVEEGVWHCHHCGYSGTLKGGNQPTEIHWDKPKYRKPDPKPIIKLPKRVLNWFASRGIAQETLETFKITTAKVYMPQVEDFVQAIVFPYLRNGEFINAKYRGSNKNFRLEAGAERILFNFDMLAEGIVFVEGEMDAMSVVQCGLPAVSVPDGAPSEHSSNYESKFRFLESAEGRISELKEVIIAVDSDAPGQRLEDELARRIGREKCKRVEWPTDCKDANEVLLKHGPEKLRECIADAKLYVAR